MDNDAHIELIQVSKTFPRGEGSNQIVEVGPVTMDVKRGELVAIMGHSGCGKTTLLNLISGLMAPTTGSIRIDGKEVEGPQSSCGFVFQEFSLFPWRTAIHNV